jgi:membrane-bound lytic murein transglycosylase B
MLSLKKIIYLIFAIQILFFAQPSFAKKKSQDQLSPNLSYLKKNLKSLELPKPFIQFALQNYEKKDFARTIRLNLLGFLKPPEHMDHVTEKAINNTMIFTKKHQKALKVAFEQYQVPPEVISSLLWIETKHGKDLGTFHIVSVYMHLIQATERNNESLIVKLALEENKKLNKYTPEALTTLMKERVVRKSKWAEEQLIALSEIHKRNNTKLRTLRGSFAGAFGLAQFIPSSFRDFAVSFNKNKFIDLKKPEDAILSVAHYLNQHGWDPSRASTQLEALKKYNNSTDYADSILEIAKQASIKVIRADAQN